MTGRGVSAGLSLAVQKDLEPHDAHRDGSCEIDPEPESQWQGCSKGLADWPVDRTAWDVAAALVGATPHRQQPERPFRCSPVAGRQQATAVLLRAPPSVRAQVCGREQHPVPAGVVRAALSHSTPRGACGEDAKTRGRRSWRGRADCVENFDVGKRYLAFVNPLMAVPHGTVRKARNTDAAAQPGFQGLRAKA